jgi:uncharacterized protein (DUF1778 family)
MATATATQARIDFRATNETKALIERAAALLGMTVSEYAKWVLTEKSHEIVRETETRVLSDRDRDRFLDLLDRPAAPNQALLNAADEFKATVQRGDFKP